MSTDDERTRVTTTLTGDRLAFFERVDDETDAGSDAAVMREIVDRAREHADAQERVDRLQRRVDELEGQLRAANQRIDATNDLVEYVETERSVERRRREASALQRARWWLLGMDLDDEE
jgi:uncharacterized protein YeeX (DUF496 family)